VNFQYVLDVLIDAYVTTFMYAFCDQTIYLRTRDGDVCVMLSNLVVVVIGW
jgi:hypothetical protein